MFFPNYEKEGKGIEKDAPKKTGIALFFEILLREFWTICHINFLFLVFCLPVVTIGPSFLAMHSVMIKVIKDVPIDTFYEFKKAFKENFKQGFVLFAISFVICNIFLLAYYFYGSINQNLSYMVVFLILVYVFYTNYIGTLAVTIELKIKDLYKNSIILTSICLKQSLLAMGIITVGGILFRTFYPYSVLYLCLFGIAFGVFVNCFIVFAGIKKYLIK